MILIPIGIIRDSHIIPINGPEAYYISQQDGVHVLSDSKEKPLVIMSSNQNEPLEWKVIHGSTQYYFRTQAEAVEFCNSLLFRQLDEPNGDK